MDKHDPIGKMVLKVKDEKPWYNNEMRHLKLMVRNRENIWKKYKDDHQWMVYKIACN